MTTPFQHHIEILKSDIDELGHVNNVVYLRWVQEVAAKHWETIANDDLKNSYKWVVLRHEIDYKNPAFLKDEVIGSTWVGDYNGARFERFVKLVSSTTGKVLAEAKTIWCMIDAATGKPMRIPPEVLAVL
jgi:acyl-CoA thioester hydrolase